MKSALKLLACSALAVALTAPLAMRADTVETTDGSKLQGKILKVDGGVIEIDTAFAGVVKIKQSAVVVIATDAPVYLRTKAGNTVQGTVSTAAGDIRVAGTGATNSATVANVDAVWLTPDQSPEARAAAAAKRFWAFDAAVDVLGKTGNSESLATSFGFTATLAGPDDKLGFYASYTRAKSDGAISANQSKAGVDYASNFSSDLSWYVREEIGTDKIQSLNFYSTTAAGLGFKVINTKQQQLTFRGGLAYRFEGYRDDGLPATKDSVSAPALDLALIHSYTATTWRIGNSLTFLPSLEHFSNYRLLHDSFYETPLAASQWKVRVGVSNDYNSQPRPGKEKLDTTYYTKFLLSWK